MMTDRPGSVKTIAAAERAASLASATATPTLALDNAGASFTPSPAMDREIGNRNREKKKIYQS